MIGGRERKEGDLGKREGRIVTDREGEKVGKEREKKGREGYEKGESEKEREGSKAVLKIGNASKYYIRRPGRSKGNEKI